jgi:hypothetical protein
MWKMTLAALSGVFIIASTATAKPRPIQEVESAIGGFIAGVVASEILEPELNIHYTNGYCEKPYSRNNFRHDTEKESYRDWNRFDNRYRYGDHKYNRKGHWEYRKQKVWIPGHWEYVMSRHGHERRVWIDGYYTIRKVKVWVPNYREDWRRRY